MSHLLTCGFSVFQKAKNARVLNFDGHLKIIFTFRIYYIDIPEDKISQNSVEKAAPIGKVSAMDADADENAAIKYSIISGNKAFVFSIDSETGEIYLQQNLDREVQVIFFWFFIFQSVNPIIKGL